MTNALKSQVQIGTAKLIENQLVDDVARHLTAIRAAFAVPAPLLGQPERTGNATPRGAIGAQSLSPSLRPHSSFQGQSEGGK